MKVICYARVSAFHQNPENQLIELRAAAERYGWTIIKSMLTTASVERKVVISVLSLMQ